MTMYRCAVCGSPNVVKNERDGFSYKKALVGTAVFGAAGVVAGINGKKNDLYVCPDCGNVLPQPMDTITKDKIDLVMTAPELLAPKIYPQIYDDYAYLRKEKERRDEAAVEKAAAMPDSFANPLNVTEAQFREAAKKFYQAYSQLTSCNQRLGFSTLEYAVSAITDMPSVCEGLRSVRTITFGLSAYPELIMQSDSTKSGLERGVLCAAVVLHILMENDNKMSLDDFYDTVVSDPLYKQVFMTIFGGEYRNALKFRQETIYGGVKSADSFNAADLKSVWFYALGKPYIGVQDCLKDAPRVMSLGNKPGSVFEFPFKLINESLYMPYQGSGEEQFEREMPELARNIAETQTERESIRDTINGLRNSFPSLKEKEAQKQVDELRRENTDKYEQIAKLKKKIFGKKKAAEEIRVLEAQIAEIQQNIEEQKVCIQDAKRKREEEALDRIAQQEEKCAIVCQALDELEKQKAEYIAHLPKWTCIAGPDAEM